MSPRCLTWIVIDSVRQCYRCTRCGREESIVVPARLDAFLLRGKAFTADHRHCKPMTREVDDGPHAA